MTKRRGRPLGIWLLLLTLWVLARAEIAGFSAQDKRHNIAAKLVTDPISKLKNTSDTHATLPATSVNRSPIFLAARSHNVPLPRSAKMQSPKADFWPQTSVPNAVSRDQSISAAVGIKLPQMPMATALAVMQSSGTKSADMPRVPSAPIAQVTKRHSQPTFYAYSFWRGGDSANVGAAPAAQYGGSQSGVIGSIALTKNGDAGPSFFLRTAVTPGKFAEQEAAAGLRWRPVSFLPLTISAERRFRAKGKDQFALYVAGSAQDIKLTAGFKARGFAQSGIIPGQKPDWFFDAGVRADREVFHSTNLALSLGVGSWAGGQRGAQRVDIGPSVRSIVDVSGLKIEIAADWRLRAAGNARPRNGPTLTISTGF